MNEHCGICGQEMDDTREICPSCKANIRAIRAEAENAALKAEVRLAKDSIRTLSVAAGAAEAEVAALKAEVALLREKLDGQLAAFNSRHEEIEQARREVERLRALCAEAVDWGIKAEEGECTYGISCRCGRCELANKLRAAGRGEGE